MKTISIDQIKNTIIEEITQGLSEKIETAGPQIEDALLSASIQSATASIKDLANSFEDLAWETYLTNILKCKDILSWLRQLGAKKALKFVSYQTIMITLPSGKKIQVRSPFFVKAAPKKGRKKKGPANRGEHLGCRTSLYLMAIVSWHFVPIDFLKKYRNIISTKPTFKKEENFS